ncbi:MAG: hypothetical protein ACK4XJ_09970 [Fimbriimonadaceae bacterium]
MNIQQLVSAWVLGLALVITAGCGGNGSDNGSNAAAFAGSYATAYNRVGGTVLIQVHADGKIDIVVNDETAGFFSGTGTIGNNNSFNVTCSGAGAATVTISGNLTGSGAGRTANGTVAGTFNVPFSAPFTTEPNHSIFAGDYEGGFTGDGQGHWHATVNSSGQLTGQAMSDQFGTFSITGQLTATGSATISGTAQGDIGTVTVTYSGTFRLTPNNIVCSGGWTSSLGGNGAWEGHRVVMQE